MLPAISVHPRWRGEHHYFVVSVISISGSSPLARGTQLLLDAWFDVERFIPAGAGNTSPSDSAIRWMKVHPRWRGEHGKTSGDFKEIDGSSPLARGTRAESSAT